MAIPAFLKVMARREIFPMAFLIRAHDPVSHAERAGTFQGGQHCTANKLGAVGNAFHRLGQGRIYLKGIDRFFDL